MLLQVVKVLALFTVVWHSSFSSAESPPLLLQELLVNFSTALDVAYPSDRAIVEEVPLQFAQVLAVTKPTCASGLLHMALHLVFEATASATKDHIATYGTASVSRARAQRLAPWKYSLFDMLLASVGCVDSLDKRNATLLQVATALQLPGAVRRLLKAGADPALALDRAGLGPLHLAARNCDRRLFDLLLSQGVNHSTRTKGGHTPLQVARVIGCQLGKGGHNDQIKAIPVLNLHPNRRVAGWRTSASFESQCDFAEVPASASVTQLQTYLDLGRPFIMRNTTTSLQQERLTRESLLKGFSQTDVDVSSIPYGGLFGVRQGLATLQEFVNYMDRDALVDSEPLYVFDHEWLDKYRPELVQLPLGLQHWSHFEQVHQFILGPAGSGSPHHYHQFAVNTLVHGAKWWLLSPPGKASYDKRHPLKVERLGLICTQGPGDTIVVPKYWGHSTINLAESIGFAIEFDHEACLRHPTRKCSGASL